MKHTQMLGRFALLVGTVLGLSMGSAFSQTSLKFTAFETGGITNPNDLNSIEITGLVIATSGGVKIGIQNDSQPGNDWITSSQPTITKIFFEDGAGALSSQVSVDSSSSGVSFARNNGLNLPGGNNIGFSVESAFNATPPPPKNGLDPNQWIYFFFSGSDYNSVVAGLSDGSIRIAMHVQEIGNSGGSAAFVNTTVPEPSAALLGALSLVGLLARRRRA